MAAAVAAITLLGSLAGCGSTSSASGATGPSSVTVDAAYLLQVQATVLVNSRGYALYMFAPDGQRHVTCVSLCAGSWPPVYIAAGGQAHAGHSVIERLLGSDTDPAGGRVVTYNSWPLYTYDADVQPRIATGQGIDDDGGYWYLMGVDGTPVDPAGDGTPPVPTT